MKQSWRRKRVFSPHLMCFYGSILSTTLKMSSQASFIQRNISILAWKLLFFLAAILAQYPATKMSGLQATTADTRGLTHNGNKTRHVQRTRVSAVNRRQETISRKTQGSLELRRDVKQWASFSDGDPTEHVWGSFRRSSTCPLCSWCSTWTPASNRGS